MAVIVCKRCGNTVNVQRSDAIYCYECRVKVNRENARKSQKKYREKRKNQPKEKTEIKPKIYVKDTKRREFLREKIDVLYDFGITKIPNDLKEKWADLSVTEMAIERDCRKLIDTKLDRYKILHFENK